MSNIHTLPAIDRQELLTAIDNEIRENCYREVDKRLALRLARTLLGGSGEGGIFYAQRLVHILKDRIDYRAKLTSDYL